MAIASAPSTPGRGPAPPTRPRPDPHRAEFERALRAETSDLLRQRFWWVIGSAATLYVFFRTLLLLAWGVLSVSAIAGAGTERLAEQTLRGVWMGRIGLLVVGGLTIVDAAALAWAVAKVLRRPDPDQLLKITQWLFVAVGVSHIAVMVIFRSPGFPWVIGVYHFLACAFLPWTAWQALAPMGLLLAVNAAATLLFSPHEFPWRVPLVVLSPVAAAPGMVTAWLRHTRRLEAVRSRVMRDRYTAIRRELVDAQRIHEALFPAPVEDGPIRLDFRYQPMLQIGGDYLYARRSPPLGMGGAGDEGEGGAGGGDGAFNLLLLDVTGHGIAAALTVNRLYGEVERLFAEDPHAAPGQVLSALNRYVHLTLATHSVYVTALCVRVLPGEDALEYASGGHPPAFACRADGTVDRLDSTAIVLGACAGDDFDPCVCRVRFGPGDTLLAYTDGALECRNHLGKMLGLAGMARTLAGLHSPARAGRCGLAADVLAAVEDHRHGPAEDDTLIVEVTRVAAPATAGDDSAERPGAVVGVGRGEAG